VAAFALNCLSKFARNHTSGETLPQRYALPGSEIDPHFFAAPLPFLTRRSSQVALLKLDLDHWRRFMEPPYL
jgi:hypothetical protein